MKHELHCPFCGNLIHPGDQKCVSCGQAIPNVEFSLKDLETKNINQKKKSNFIYILVGGILLFLILLFCYFLVR